VCSSRSRTGRGGKVEKRAGESNTISKRSRRKGEKLFLHREIAASTSQIGIGGGKTRRDHALSIENGRGG